MRLVRACEFVVIAHRQPVAGFTPRPAHHRLGERQRAHRDALLVHGGNARVEVDEARTGRTRGQVADLELRTLARVRDRVY